MAANMPQMAGNGHMMQQNGQRQLQAAVYNQLMSNPPPLQGWQAGMNIAERFGKTMNLISNIILAMPGAEWQKAASFGVEFEKKALLSSPDRQTYDRQIQSKIAELAKKRESNAPDLQNQLNADAQRQAQAQAQAQQQMMLQARMAAGGMGQPSQQGYQHLQHQMQVSPIPQPQQQMGMGMGNPGMQQSPLNQQPPFQMPMQQPRPPGAGSANLAALPPQDRTKVLEYANQLYTNASEEQKASLRVDLQSRINPQHLAEFRASGRDVLVPYYQQQAFAALQKHAQQQRMLQQQRAGGLPPNANPAQAGLHMGQGQPQQKQPQPRPMNQAMMNPIGQQPGAGSGGQLFSSNLEIVNGQKAGLLAEQAGQMVVPANSGTGRNATPQPMAGMPPQNMPNSQPGPNQQPRPAPMGPAYGLTQVKMDQAAAQSQAQIKAQAAARQMANPPGGSAGPTSQSPGMSTLNAAMSQPPVAMGSQANGPRANQGNPAMGQPLNPRFNHQGNNRPVSMPGNMSNMNINPQVYEHMMNSISPEQRQSVSNLPAEKLRELVASWQEQRNSMNNGGQPPKQPHMLGQPQPHMGQMTGAGQFAGGPSQPPNAAAGNQNILSQMAARARLNGGAPNHAQAQRVMDSMDIPMHILQQMRSAMPPDIKKWAQLKAWLPQSTLPHQAQQQLLNFQIQQFRQALERRGAAPNNAQQPGAMAGGQHPQPGPVQPQQQQGMPNLPPNFPMPAQSLQVTPHEIESLRRNSKFANRDDNELMQIAQRMKQEQFMRRMQQAQLQQQQQQREQQQREQQQREQQQHASNHNAHVSMNQLQPGHVPPPATTQPDTAPSQPKVSQAAPQKPAPAVSESNPAGAKNSRAPQNRSAPNPSPAQAQRSLKRPRPDDTAEPPQANAMPNQRPNSQAGAPPAGQLPRLTAEQPAGMTPEHRQKWEQMLRNHQQLQATPEDMSRLKALGAEEHQQLQHENMPEIPMTAEEKGNIKAKIQQTVGHMAKIGKAFSKWYAITHDDARARMYFRTRIRLIRQFDDGDKMQRLKNNFSIQADELDTARAMLESMAKDLARFLPIAKKGNAGAAAQSQQSPQPVPLSATNLEKQTQALNKAHNRSNSKSGKPPVEPTAAQPPFPPGAQMTPTSHPKYLGKPRVTQDNLQLPAPRKKAKTTPRQAPATTPQQASAPPQVKAPPSPKAERQQPPEPKAPPRPVLMCPEADCETHGTGFPNQDALNAHIQEEHVKPNEDPFKFVQENLALKLGLDSHGQSRAPPRAPAVDGLQLAGPPMGASLSMQGQTPMSKADLASTPMSRDTSMKRQGSSIGAKGAATPGRGAPIKGDSTPRTANGKFPAAKPEPEMVQAPVAEDLWANATIDPQSLVSSFAPLELVAGGVISDINVYRSLTPNDTPESSKDSGSSEPNSDISENANIDIDVNWQPVESDLLLDMNNFTMEGYESLESDLIMPADSALQFPSWDDISTDLQKPFQFDSSLFTVDNL